MTETRWPAKSKLFMILTFSEMSADPCFRSLLPPEQNYHKNLDGNVISILLK